MSEGLDPTMVAYIDARFAELRDLHVRESEQSAASRQGVYRKLEELALRQQQVGFLVDSIQKEFDDTRPTIREFVDYKAQVRGAGKLGIALYAFGGFVLVVAGFFYSKWDALLRAIAAFGGR